MHKYIGLVLGFIKQYYQFMRYLNYKFIWKHVEFWVDIEVRDQKENDHLTKVDQIKEKYSTWTGKDTGELLLNNAIYLVLL